MVSEPSEINKVSTMAKKKKKKKKKRKRKRICKVRLPYGNHKLFEEQLLAKQHEKKRNRAAVIKVSTVVVVAVETAVVMNDCCESMPLLVKPLDPTTAVRSTYEQ